MGLLNPHKGSWLGLPDFGITEFAQNLFRPNELRSFQGGSNLFGPTPKAFTPSSSSQSGMWDNASPTPTPTTTSRGGSVLGTGTFNQIPAFSPPTQPDFSSIGPSDAELDSIYSPAMANLGQQEQYLREAQPIYEAQVGRETDLAKQSLEAQKSQSLADMAAQERSIETEKENAWSQARRLFNEISQQNISRFGAGSSTGPAAAEILGKETERAFSQANIAASMGISEINRFRNALNEQVVLRMQEINDQKQAGLEQIRNKFRDDMLRIEASRSMLASAKAAARIEALKAARTMAWNWAENQENYRQQLALWKLQNQTRLDNSLAQIISTVPSNETIRTFKRNIQAPTNDFGKRFDTANSALAALTPMPKLQGLITTEKKRNPLDELLYA